MGVFLTHTCSGVCPVGPSRLSSFNIIFPCIINSTLPSPISDTELSCPRSPWRLFANHAREPCSSQACLQFNCASVAPALFFHYFPFLHPSSSRPNLGVAPEQTVTLHMVQVSPFLELVTVAHQIADVSCSVTCSSFCPLVRTSRSRYTKQTCLF